MTEAQRKTRSSENESSHLRKVRGGYRAQVSRHLQESPESVQSVPAKLKQLERYSQTLKDCDDAILRLLDDQTEIEREVLECCNIQDSIDSYKCLLVRDEPFQDAPSQAPSQGVCRRAKLPKLVLRKFYGDTLEWKPFWQQFASTVHDNDEISQIDKFSYLVNALADEPLSVIKGVAITDSNYPTAISLLEERYGQEHAIVNAHMEGLLDVPGITDTSKLRVLYDSLEKHFRGLEALDKGLDSLMMVPLVLKKLPTDCRLHLSRSLGDKVWDLSSLRAALGAEVKNRERVTMGSTVAKKGEKRNGALDVLPHRVVDEPTGTCSSLLAPTKAMCVFCDAEHASENCRKLGSEKHAAIKAKRLCFVCLGGGHSAYRCFNRGKLACKVGRLHHHPCLCDHYHRPDGSLQAGLPHLGSEKGQRPTCNVSKGSSDKHDKPQIPKNGTNLFAVNGRSVLVKTVVCWVCVKGKKVRANVVLDDCSQSSYVTRQFANRLAVRTTGTVNLSISAFQSKSPLSQVCDVTELDVICADGSVETLEAVIVDSVAPPLDRHKVHSEAEAQLAGLPLADPKCLTRSTFRIDILIGAADYYRFVRGDIRRFANGLVASRTAFGWVLTGPVAVCTAEKSSTSTFFIDSRVDTGGTIESQLEKLWELEALGIKPDETGSVDTQVLSRFQNTIERADTGRYYVKFPWNDERVNELPDNRNLAIRRFRMLQRRLKESPFLADKYFEYMSEQLRRDFIEVVADESIKEGVTHYLSHHPVVKSDSRFTKLRVVYDASARTKNSYSLNDVIYEGPNLIGDLFAILTRFRLREIGITADIEKAFLMVGLQRDQRDCTRFFWCESLDNPKLTVMRFKVVPFGVIASPFLLNATVQHLLENSSTSCASTLIGSMYVDNAVVSVDSVDAATEFYRESKELFAQAAMNLREWVTNSIQLKDDLEPADRINDDESKVLGLRWKIRSDQLYVSFSTDLSTPDQVTRRFVLRVASSAFDPLGFVVPLTIAAKVFMQKLWLQPAQWDDPIPDQMLDEWNSIVSQLKSIPEFVVPRHVGVKFDSVQVLHIFSDASPKVYGVAVYLVVMAAGKAPMQRLLCAKARVSPVKRRLTLPRLELMGVLLAVRMEKKLRSELKIEIQSSTVWTDSMIALNWINSNKSREIFVRNRVQEIRSSHSDFRYVPSEENPADVCTRFITSEELTKCDAWWNGPTWLSDPPMFAPVDGAFQTNGPQASRGVDNGDVSEPSILSLPVQDSVEREIASPFGIDITRFSSVSKLLRTTSFCRRFVEKRAGVGVVSADELNESMSDWVRYVQQRHFGSVLSDIQHNRRSGFVREMGLFLDEQGLIRSKSRLAYADISEMAKCPILLAKNTRFTDMLIRSLHEKTMHQGLPAVVAAVQAEYWIPQCKRQVKRVLRQCVICKRWQARPFNPPPSAPLPDFRVNTQAPFACSGVDFAGPLECKDGKVWICLFSCTATRALHLELVCDMSTQTFILALRRFVARRGCPDRIVSDNAKTFKLARTYLEFQWKEVLADDSIQSYVSERGITWQFNIERAPWWGGFFERMVGLVKQCLRKSMGRRLITKCELETQLCEVEAVLNSRPITYVYDTVGHEALTPAQLCGYRGVLGFPGAGLRGSGLRGSGYRGSGLRGSGLRGSGSRGQDEDWVPKEDSVQVLKKRLQLTRTILDNFWKRWRSEYLMHLRDFHVKTKKDEKRIPKVNEIVLIKDDLPRGMWRLGKINNLIVGKDGIVRGAALKTAKQSLQRPIQLLIPLEVRATDEAVNEKDHEEGEEVQSEVQDAKVRRNAAIEAEKRFKDAFGPAEDVEI